MGSLKKETYVGIIANSISPHHRVELELELGPPENNFFKPLKFNYKQLEGDIILLDIQPQEMMSLQGMKKGRAALFLAVDSLIERGARVICLAASTKRLAGKSGKVLKDKYPDIVFTIGDNATAISFVRIIEKVLYDLNFNKDFDSVFCLGSGFLGSHAINYLSSRNLKNLIVLSEYQQDFSSNVRIVKNIEEVGVPIRLMLSCTHKYDLQPGSLNFLECDSTIVDIAVPSGVSKELYNSLSCDLSRFDAGDYYLDDLDYSFSPSLLSIPFKGLWYGCFTEAVLLGLALKEGVLLNSHFDFFEINQNNQKLIKEYLDKEDVKVPLINFYNLNNNLVFI